MDVLIEYYPQLCCVVCSDRPSNSNYRAEFHRLLSGMSCASSKYSAVFSVPTLARARHKTRLIPYAPTKFGL